MFLIPRGFPFESPQFCLAYKRKKKKADTAFYLFILVDNPVQLPRLGHPVEVEVEEVCVRRTLGESKGALTVRQSELCANYQTLLEVLKTLHYRFW